MALSQSTPSVPPRCCSPLLPSSPFPPLAFEFTFYAPLSTPTASYFYSQEPLHRTKMGIVSIDEEVWGEREGKEDETDRFIRDAMKFGEGLDKDQNEIMIKGRAGREVEGLEGESGKKRIREGSESLSSRGVGEGGRVEKRSRVEEPQEENDRGGGVATDVVRSIRRDSRASPSYELNPSLEVDEPILPFRRLIDTAAHAVQRYVSFADMDSYLTPDPMPASHSHNFFSTLLEFMAYVEPPSTWETPKGQSMFRKRDAGSLSLRIRKYSPNFEKIRTDSPLGSVEYGNRDRDDSVFGNTSVSLSVVAWLWGQYPDIANLRWVVEKSPLPVFVLFLEYVTVARFIEAAEHAQRRFLHYLSNTPSLSPRAERAKILVRWLEKTDRKNERWELFFGSAQERDDSGGPIWDWWFDDLGCERFEAELNEWERRKLCGGNEK